MEFSILNRRSLVKAACTAAVALAYGGATRPAATILRTETPLEAAATAMRTGAATGLLERVSLAFERNEGQFDGQVRYAARGEGYEIALRRDGARLALARADARSAARITVRFEASRPARIMTGIDALQDKSHSDRGGNSSGWPADVPSFARVRATAIYDGIDVEYYGRDRQLEYDFLVAAGADASQIVLAFDGVDHVAVDPSGDLLLQVGTHTIRQHRPVAFQTHRSGRTSVRADYLLLGARRVVIALGDYDRNRPLVIDPVLAY